MSAKFMKKARIFNMQKHNWIPEGNLTRIFGNQIGSVYIGIAVPAAHNIYFLKCQKSGADSEYHGDGPAPRLN